MKPTYLGYSADTIQSTDRVVSYPHNKTKMRLHGDVVHINHATNELIVNYNRTETPDGQIIEKGYGITTLHLDRGQFSGGDSNSLGQIGTSLDVELIIRGEE